MYTVCCEAFFNAHPEVARSALVGVGERPRHRPVVWIEPVPRERTRKQRQALVDACLAIARENEMTRPIRDVLLHRSFPVDIRHNAKIFREGLAREAAARLGVAMQAVATEPRNP
jgi:hypothetical protein